MVQLIVVAIIPLTVIVVSYTRVVYRPMTEDRHDEETAMDLSMIAVALTPA